MKKLGTIILPLLFLGWFVAVMFPGQIPGVEYVGPYLLPMIVIFIIIRAVSSAQKKQVKQTPNQYSIPTPDPANSNTGPPAPTATWAPPPATAPPFPPADNPIPATTTYPSPQPSPTPAPIPTPGASPAEAPTGVDALPADLVARLRELRTGGRTIEAVELLREHTGMELYEASRLVIGLDADD